MLYAWEQGLKQHFVALPLGVRRLWMAASVVWLLGYLILNWNDLALLWEGATSSPIATCADVFPGSSQRRSACESASGLPDINAYLQGKSEPFQPFFEKNRRDEKLIIWLGVPVAWLGLIWAFLWVRRGFEEDRAK